MDWFKEILKGPTSFHLWYFYALIGIYSFIPVLQKFYCNSSKREKQWFIAVWFLVSSIIPIAWNPLVNEEFICEGPMDINGFLSTYSASYFGGYIGYLMLGAYAAEIKPNQRLGWVIFLGSSIITMIGTYYLTSYFPESVFPTPHVRHKSLT